MKKNIPLIILGAGIVGIILLVSVIMSRPQYKLARIRLPSGFSITLYADNVPDARSLAVGDKGTVFVGSRSEGKVYALVDRNKDGKADRVIVIAENLRIPNGIAFYKGSLYVAELHRIVKFDRIEEGLGRRKAQPVEINNKLPKEVLHGWRYLRVGPDHSLYVSVGAPCDVCKERDKRYASILRLKPDGSNLEVFAHGVRQCEGFDWYPKTHTMFFTDNGKESNDMSIPLDELNQAGSKGMHFGYPYCHAGAALDGVFGKGRTCDKYSSPILLFPDRVAPLGVSFYTGKLFPEEYHNRLFIAEHGAGNKGYRITTVTPAESGARYTVFASGWFENNTAWGRPVDLLVMPDGALLVSDDRMGAVYRISYSKKKENRK